VVIRLAAMLGFNRSQANSGKDRLDRIGGPNMPPVYGRIIIERQHGVLVFDQEGHRFRIFRLEPFKVVIKGLINRFPGFHLSDRVQRLLDLGLHGFRQLFQYIVGLVRPAAQMIGFRPEFTDRYSEAQRSVVDGQPGCRLQSSLP
jgi:hypothetical protein